MNKFQYKPDSAQTILMCPPNFFNVDYVINPWMQSNCGKVDAATAQGQWENLRQKLMAKGDVVTMPPQPGLPDLVFTANAGLVYGDIFVPSRFRSAERQGEEPHFRQWFAEAGYQVPDWPKDVYFEGAGDALWDRSQAMLWAGYGFRSDVNAQWFLAEILRIPVQSLELVDPRFYHLDTCFCPLSDGYLMYYPKAFSQASLIAIESAVPLAQRIIVPEADAVEFACNAVELDRHLFMNHASAGLQAQLFKAGFGVTVCPLSEFLKSGGTAKCLTIKLLEPPYTGAMRTRSAA